MPGRGVTGLLAFALFTALHIAPAGAADDAGIERMILCQDSWLDWQKAGDPRLPKFAERLRAGFTRTGNNAYAVPNAPTTVAGFRILQLYPDSVGMGVGFSVLVDATYDKARQSVERALGKPLKPCEASDGMRSCELQISEQRTVTLMAQDSPNNASTLLGCYYYYEK
jgi:hypothetical protein